MLAHRTQAICKDWERWLDLFVCWICSLTFLCFIFFIVSILLFKIFKIKCVGVTLFNKVIYLSIVQFFNIVHHLHIALCAHLPKSNLILSPIFHPLYTLQLLHPLPSGKHHIAVCIYVFLFVCLFCVCVHLLVSILYPTWE